MTIPASPNTPNDFFVDQNKSLNASYKIVSILRQSKLSIERIIDDLPDIFGIIDHNGMIVKGNHSLAKLLRVGIESLLDKNISELFTENNWWLFKQNIGHLFSQNAIEFELGVETESIDKKIFIWKVKRIQTSKKTNIPLYFLLGSDVTILRDREIKLKHLTEKLQDLVNEKTKDITSLLDSIDQGIFSVNQDMTLNEAHSKKAEEIFYTSDFGGKTLGEFLQLSEQQINDFKNWYAIARSKQGLKRWHKYAALCPIQQMTFLQPNQRIIMFEYLPILKDEEFRQLLVLATDITERVKNAEKIKEAERVQALQTERILALVRNISISVNIFFDETEDYLAKLHALATPELLTEQAKSTFNILHTLKGNAGSLGFHYLSSIVNTMEDIIEKFIHVQIDDVSDIWPQWQDSFRQLDQEFEEMKKLRKMLFSGSQDSIPVNKSIYHDLVINLKANQHLPGYKEIFAKVQDLDSHRLVDLCQKYNNIIRLYREQNHKSISELVVTNPDFLVRRDIIALFDPAIVHLIRNAADHGIEEDEERTSNKKGPGQITISCRFDNHTYIMSIEDNGKGIDPTIIANSAVSKGIIPKDEVDKLSDKEKVELIFTQGFSTKNETTSISGRGVGLDAVKKFMEEQNGSVELISQVGVGTTFILRIPKPPIS